MESFEEEVIQVGRIRTKSTASGFSLDYSCALSVRKGKSKHRGKGES